MKEKALNGNERLFNPSWRPRVPLASDVDLRQFGLYSNGFVATCGNGVMGVTMDCCFVLVALLG